MPRFCPSCYQEKPNGQFRKTPSHLNYCRKCVGKRTPEEHLVAFITAEANAKGNNYLSDEQCIPKMEKVFILNRERAKLVALLSGDANVITYNDDGIEVVEMIQL